LGKGILLEASRGYESKLLEYKVQNKHVFAMM
jgi:hypothetical protein